MVQGPSPQLDEMIAAMPTDRRGYERRHLAVRSAVLAVAPQLASAKTDAVRPQDLRTIFLALDLFFFGSRYQTVFENMGRVEFVWCLAEKGGDDCHLVRYREGDPHEGEDESTLLELHVAPDHVVGCEDADSALVDGLIGAMLRLMVLGASVVAEIEAKPGLATAARLIRRMRALA